MQATKHSIEKPETLPCAAEGTNSMSEKDKNFVSDNARLLIDAIAKGRPQEIPEWWKRLKEDTRLPCTLEYLGALVLTMDLLLFENETSDIVLMDKEGHSIVLNKKTTHGSNRSFQKVRESLMVGMALFDLYSS